jgi:hypothetical protein
MTDQTATKNCSKCGSAMTLEARPRPATGTMFVAPKQWRCGNAECRHTEDAS